MTTDKHLKTHTLRCWLSPPLVRTSERSPLSRKKHTGGGAWQPRVCRFVTVVDTRRHNFGSCQRKGGGGGEFSPLLCDVKLRDFFWRVRSVMREDIEFRYLSIFPSFLSAPLANKRLLCSCLGKASLLPGVLFCRSKRGGAAARGQTMGVGVICTGAWWAFVYLFVLRGVGFAAVWACAGNVLPRAHGFGVASSI